MSGDPYLRPVILDKIGLGTHRVIEASAGTGKTFTLEHLIVELLVRKKAQLDQILAVTFTQRATAELRARVRAAVDRALRAAYAGDEAIKAAFPGVELVAPLEAALFSFERAPIHTIHSFCQRVLTELAFDTGARFGTEAADGRALFHEAFRAVLREKKIASSEYAGPLAKWVGDFGKSVDDLEKMLFEVSSNHYEPNVGGYETSTETLLAGLLVPPIRKWLRAEKFRRGVIDYDDMLERVHEALTDDTSGRLVAALRSRFRFALIDEFQDTDEIQWEIFRKIFVADHSESALYLIGDPKQAIYSFRGADVQAYLRARSQIAAPPNDPIALVENFRSTAAMVAAINEILDQNANPPLFKSAIQYQNPVSCGREDLHARMAGKDLVPITLIAAKRGAKYNAAALRRMLACRIAATIKTIVKDPGSAITVTDGAKPGPAVNYGDIYILTNTNAEGVKLAEYLRAESVPYAFYKREGLFQTDEAHDVLDMLRAVAAPNNRSYRLKAWATPFFAVPMRELAKLVEPEPSDPLMARLAKWHGLANDGDFAELFDSLLEDSGLAARQLFGAPNLRELTNYEHLFELILEESMREGWSIADIIDRLAAYVGEYRLPSGEDPNLMRLESERAAVQIMTIHKAKGLEARVVFVFGGFFANNNPRPMKIYHDREGDRQLAIGSEAQRKEKKKIDQDEAEESQRLLYVAITRARAKLYLPYVPTKPGRNDITGRYRQLNDRLRAMDAAGQLAEPLFETVALEMQPRQQSPSANAIGGWQPPASLLSDPGVAKLESEIASLARASAALSTLSYTSLHRRTAAAAEAAEIDPTEYKSDLEPAADVAEITSEPRGGAAAGIFLHEVIEKLDLKTLAAAGDPAIWGALPEIRELFDSALRRHQVPERERWMTRGPEVVFNALRSPIVAGALTIPALAGCESSREMEFAFPRPEAAHRLLDSVPANDDARWRIERGVYVGFVDFVFRYENRVYFADWKSDLMASYEPNWVTEHAQKNYSLQAKIYTIGVTRLLGIQTEAEYEAGFGGLLYVFIRGITPAGGGKRGIYFHRPPWSEVVRAERELMRPFEMKRK
jgi:exodeoxyribonuclease V beta subunit